MVRSAEHTECRCFAIVGRVANIYLGDGPLADIAKEGGGILAAGHWGRTEYALRNHLNAPEQFPPQFVRRLRDRIEEVPLQDVCPENLSEPSSPKGLHGLRQSACGPGLVVNAHQSSRLSCVSGITSAKKKEESGDIRRYVLVGKRRWRPHSLVELAEEKQMVCASGHEGRRFAIRQFWKQCRVCLIRIRNAPNSFAFECCTRLLQSKLFGDKGCIRLGQKLRQSAQVET
jgi:hypothetical protein